MNVSKHNFQLFLILLLCLGAIGAFCLYCRATFSSQLLAPSSEEIQNLKNQNDLLNKKIDQLRGLLKNAQHLAYIPNVPLKNFPENIQSYRVKVLQLGGIGSYFYQLTAGSPEPATQGEAEEYSFDYDVSELGYVSFNGGQDILNLSCKQGYRPSDAKSFSKNKVYEGDGNYYALQLEDKLQNEMSILCTKKE